jgi:hypothetical protein
VPTVENVVVHWAEPPVMVADPQPVIVVPLFWKLTVPEGLVPPPVTVAVIVVEVPTVEGEGLALTEVVLVPLLTTSDVVPVEVL